MRERFLPLTDRNNCILSEIGTTEIRCRLRGGVGWGHGEGHILHSHSAVAWRAAKVNSSAFVLSNDPCQLASVPSSYVASPRRLGAAPDGMHPSAAGRAQLTTSTTDRTLSSTPAPTPNPQPHPTPTLTSTSTPTAHPRVPRQLAHEPKQHVRAKHSPGLHNPLWQFCLTCG